MPIPIDPDTTYELSEARAYYQQHQAAADGRTIEAGEQVIKFVVEESWGHRFGVSKNTINYDKLQ